MQSKSSQVIKTGSSVDLAFAVVVMASYFSTFSSIKDASNLEIALMAVFGIAYLAIGIYGYKLAAHSDSLVLHMIYFLVQIVIGSLIVYLSRGAGFNILILLPLAGHAVVLLPPLWLYITNTFVVFGYAIAVAAYSNSLDPVWSALPTFLAGVVFIMVFTQMAVGEEKARMEVERLVKDLAEANRRLRQNAIQAEELAVTRERNRLAREIHDGLGHYLTTIYMQIQAGMAVMNRDPNRARDALEKAQNLSQQALLDVRRSVAALRSRSEESLPINESIEEMLADCETAGLRSRLQILGEPRALSPQAQLTIYRAAQESINNTLKHARATQLNMTLDYTEPGSICFSAIDNGVGAEHTDGGFGLLGLRERALLLNGSLQVSTAKGKGFMLKLMVPG